MKINLIKAIQQAVWIFLLAIILGFAANIFHPKKVKITCKRPPLKFAPDTVLAQDLPDVSVIGAEVSTNEVKIETLEPLIITTMQLLQLKENDLAVIIDARTKTEFLKSHISSAQNIPYKNLAEYKTNIETLSKDKWLICYCDGPPCDQAELLAHELIIAEYKLVAVYFDGLNGWKDSGHEIAGSEAL